MLALALAVVLSGSPELPQSRFWRFGERTESGRSKRGFWPDSFAAFEFAPLSGTGMPATPGCYAAASLKGARGEASTFTRASVAYVPSADGQTWTACSNDQVRVTTGNQLDTQLGVFVEPTATNQISWPSDMTQAIWVKTTMTCTHTVTSPTGAANSGSRCTASAANGTLVQTGIAGAGTNIQSLYIKRVTGSGQVLISGDNFATSTDVSASLSSVRWRRIVPRESVGCAGGDCIVVPSMAYFSAASFVAGLKLATNGDAIDLWAFQVEIPNAANVTSQPLIATSPIDDNTGARATRSPDRLFFNPSPTFKPASFSAVAQFTGNLLAVGEVVNATDGTDNLQLYMSNAGTIDQRLSCDRFSSSSANVPMPYSARTFLPIACDMIPASTITASLRGRAISTGTDVGGILTANKIQIGGRASGSGSEFSGVIRSVCADPSIGRCTSNGNSTGNPIAWLGDSITLGEAGAPERPTHALSELLHAAGAPRAVYNFGISGNTAAQCLDNWTNNVRGRGFKTLVLMCGINSLNASVPPATIWSQLQTILDQAKADGMTVIPMTILPNSVADANKDTVNASIAAWCVANGATCVDTYNSDMRSGVALAAIYNSGDNLHPNAAGSIRMAQLVQAASP